MATGGRNDFHDFQGFGTPKDMKNMDMNMRMEALETKWSRIIGMEETLHRVVSQNENFYKEIYQLTRENQDLRRDKKEIEKENNILRKQCDELRDKMAELERKLGEGEIGGKKECLQVIENKMEEVKKRNEEEHANLREIMKQQEKEKREIAQSEVVKMLKQNEDTVRDIAEKKKCIVVSGLKESFNKNWHERKRREMNMIQEVLEKISEEEDNLFGEVEEIMRLGAYEEDKNRPIKIKLKSQVTAEVILRNAWRLSNYDETKGIYIRRNMTEEERAKIKVLVMEVKERNEARSEEDKTKFFWKVRNERIKKWWIKKTQ